MVICAVRNLSVLAYAQGFTLWHYRLNNMGDLNANPNYFGSVSDMLCVSDIIMVSGGGDACQVVVRSVNSATNEVALDYMRSSM